MNTNGKVKSVLDQKNEYKNTVFGFIPKDWEIVKLKDISIRKGTYGIGAAAVEYNENLPRYLRITDIDDQGRIINEDPKCVDDPDSVNYILKKNDLVFARTGNTTGKTYLYKNEDGVLVYAGFLIKFSINPIKADSRFVKYFTETNYYWQWVGIMSMRSGQPGINENEYSKLTLPLPPLPEQQKISSILSTWDKAIELKEKLIEQKKEQKKGLMQKLLTGEVRLPGFEGKWKEVRIKDLGTLKGGSAFPEKYQNVISGKYPFFKVSDMNNEENEKYMLNANNYINEEIRSEIKATIIPKNSIIFAKVGAALLLERKRILKYDSCIDNNMMALIVKENIDFNYVYYLLLNMKLSRFSNVGALPSLNSNDVYSLKCRLPMDYDEQKAVAELLSLFDKEIDLLQNELIQIKQQKKGLMQLLLTGKVRVKV